eukprot:6474766-Amphidinium_carterae.3
MTPTSHGKRSLHLRWCYNPDRVRCLLLALFVVLPPLVSTAVICNVTKAEKDKRFQGLANKEWLCNFVQSIAAQQAMCAQR